MRQALADGGKQHALFVAGRTVEDGRVFFRTLAQVHQQRGVAAVVQDHVRALIRRTRGPELEDAVRVVPVLLQGLAFEGEHRRTCGGNGRGRVVLRGKDVARGPAHLRPQHLQRLDQHGSLDGHVQAARDARAFERMAGGVFLADRHQAGHFGFRDADFLAAPIGQADVGDHTIGGEGLFQRCVHGMTPSMVIHRRGAHGCSRHVGG